MPPAARVSDPVSHPLPPVLQPGPGSANVFIAYFPAWRGVPAAVAAGTPGAPAAKLAEETTKAAAAATMGATITSAAGGADIHACSTPLPVPPHGLGVVVDGCPTVFFNNLPAARMGDTILEAIGPPSKIIMGCPTVMIG